MFFGFGGKFNKLTNFAKRSAQIIKMPTTDSVMISTEGSPQKIIKLDQEQVHKTSRSSPLMKCAKLSDNALIPTRGSKQAAGFDLYRYVENSSLWRISHDRLNFSCWI